MYNAYVSRILPRHWTAQTIIKSNQLSGADIALRAARSAGAKFISRCGFLASDFAENKHGYNSSAARHERAHEIIIFSGADRVVVTTREMKQKATDQYHIDPSKIHIIPNYVDTTMCRPDDAIPVISNRISFIGRLDPQKNIDILFSAMQGLDVELDIVGSGREEAHLRELATTTRLKVNFLGNQPHAKLPAILNRSALFILPSRYEGHPKTLIEAMACGRPVIGTRVQGIQNVIRHDVDGYLCDANPEALRQSIKQLLSDAPLRDRLGKNARKMVMERLSLDQTVKKDLELLHGLACE